MINKCPKCGSQIYTPTIWSGIIPPSNKHTCNYNYSKVEEVTEANLKVSPYSIFELDEEEIEISKD
jgi:hypothetical protein